MWTSDAVPPGARTPLSIPRRAAAVLCETIRFPAGRGTGLPAARRRVGGRGRRAPGGGGGRALRDAPLPRRPGDRLAVDAAQDGRTAQDAAVGDRGIGLRDLDRR